MQELILSDFEKVSRRTGAVRVSRPSLSYWKDAWIRLQKNRQALASLFIVGILIFFTLAGPFLWTVDPSAQNLNRISESPNFGRTVKVVPNETPYEDVVAPGVPEAPQGTGANLAAPTNVQVMGEPSLDSVRLRWNAVTGAAGYSIYRLDRKPRDESDWGIPVYSVDGGNVVSFEDRFDLHPTTYYYSIVAKNGDESVHAATKVLTLRPTISLADAQEVDPNAKPGQMLGLSAHPLGTDYLGRDMLARLMYGARVSLFIGFFAPFLYVLLGITVGGVAGYFGGRIDEWLMRITDFVLALPFLLFMILFKIALGGQAGESGIAAMMIALVTLSWVDSARLVRGQVLQLRESEFVHASRLLGARPWYLIWRHLLPNTMGIILVYITFAVPTAIFTEAFLSFIGMGVAPPTPSWGSMCNDGVKTFLVYPHEFIFPAVIISVTVLAFNLLGDGLRDALDPKMRSRE